MGMRGRDPFPGIARDAIEHKIGSARIGRTNEIIARMRLIDGECYADIGAAVGYDRRTVARRMQRIIDQLNNA